MSERDDPWLSRVAVEHLTGTRWRRLQCERLRAMGVPFKPNAVGLPLVEASLFLTNEPVRLHRSPDWGKVKRGKAAKAQPAPAAANDDAARRVLPFGLRRG